jgi:hypothetical protein
VGHQGPLLWHDKDYNGSRFNILVEWENGEIMTEPLLVIAADNPVTRALYAREHDLLDVEGWKRFRNLAKQSSSLSCSSMEIQQTSFKMMILFRYSSYMNYLLRYMCINFIGNRPQADGE